MQLTRFSDYSLRALIYLAQRGGLNTTIADIASAHRISKSHLMKVIQNLAKQGYVRTTRGKGGESPWRTHPRRSSLEKSFGMWSRSLRSNVSFRTMLVDAGCIPTVVFAGHSRWRNFDFLETLDGYSIGDVMGRTPHPRGKTQASAGRGKPPRSR